MAVDEEVDVKRTQEMWECTTEGSVWLWVTDARDGGYRKQKFGGPTGGTKRVRITIDDRRYNQELVIDQEPEADPFRNGLLRLVSKAVVPDIDSEAHLTDEELAGLLEMRDLEVFQEAATSIKRELPLRRLKAMAETRGTQEQNGYLDELLRERYPIGGTQPTVQEMIDEEEKSSGTRLS